jgi:hypothetical protein
MCWVTKSLWLTCQWRSWVVSNGKVKRWQTVWQPWTETAVCWGQLMLNSCNLWMVPELIKFLIIIPADTLYCGILMPEIGLYSFCTFKLNRMPPNKEGVRERLCVQLVMKIEPINWTTFRMVQNSQGITSVVEVLVISIWQNPSSLWKSETWFSVFGHPT